MHTRTSIRGSPIKKEEEEETQSGLVRDESMQQNEDALSEVQQQQQEEEEETRNGLLQQLQEEDDDDGSVRVCSEEDTQSGLARDESMQQNEDALSQVQQQEEDEEETRNGLLQQQEQEDDDGSVRVCSEMAHSQVDSDLDAANETKDEAGTISRSANEEPAAPVAVPEKAATFPVENREPGNADHGASDASSSGPRRPDDSPSGGKPEAVTKQQGEARICSDHSGHPSKRRSMEDRGLTQYQSRRRFSAGSCCSSHHDIAEDDNVMTVTVRDAFEDYLIPIMSSLVSHEVQAMRKEGNDLILVFKIAKQMEGVSAEALESEIKAKLNAARREYGNGPKNSDDLVKSEVEKMKVNLLMTGVENGMARSKSGGELLGLERDLLQKGAARDTASTEASGELSGLERDLFRKGVALDPNNHHDEAQKTSVAQRRPIRGESEPGAYFARGRALGEDPGFNVPDSDDGMSARAIVTGSVDFPLEIANRDALEAFRVDEEDHERKIRQRIMGEAVEADVVDHIELSKKKKRRLIIWILVTVVLVIIAVVVSVVLVEKKKTLVLVTESPTMSPTTSPTDIFRPTIEKIRDRGSLRCGVSADATMGGFNRDLCRAVAASLLNDPDLVSFMPVTSITRFPTLQGGDVDLLIRLETHTMDRDVAERTTGAGFSFSPTILYSGLVFSGQPDYVDCAERLDTFFGICRQLKVCVNQGTSLLNVVNKLLPTSFVLAAVPANDEFVAGNCNVVANEPVVSHEQIFRDAGYRGEFVAGTVFFSREPIAAVTRSNDAEWSTFVNGVMQSLLAAEVQNVTQATAEEFNPPLFFGGFASDVFGRAIAAVGNYGEIFTRHFEGIIPRTGLNSLNVNGRTGLLYSFPFGSLETSGPPPSEGGTLQSIVDRGYLRCGLSTNFTGFSQFNESTLEWGGLDVSFCRVLSAAIFAGEAYGHIEFVSFSKDQLADGLESGEVHVLAGDIQTIVDSVKDLDVSLPYFYGSPGGSSADVAIRALVSLPDDRQFSAFVYWTIMATIYAEENFLDQTRSFEMPVVNLFGQRFVQMFRDVISSSGHYGEIYERSLGDIIPRSGRNLLNVIPFGPQQFPY